MGYSPADGYVSAAAHGTSGSPTSFPFFLNDDADSLLKSQVPQQGMYIQPMPPAAHVEESNMVKLFRGCLCV
jgi:hypothetical protein